HWDGDFILPLLQSRVGIFPLVWCCAGGTVGCHGAWWHRQFVVWSGSGAGFGASGCGVEVPGLADAVAALGFDVAGPGDAEPVAGSAAGGGVAGFDPVVDDTGAGGGATGGVGGAGLAGGGGRGGGGGGRG